MFLVVLVAVVVPLVVVLLVVVQQQEGRAEVSDYQRPLGSCPSYSFVCYRTCPCSLPWWAIVMRAQVRIRL